MNVEISGEFLNGYFKPDSKDKETGEIKLGDYVVQIQQEIQLANGDLKFEHLTIPVDRSLADEYKQYSKGDKVRVPCNVYGENYAKINISKAK